MQNKKAFIAMLRYIYLLFPYRFKTKEFVVSSARRFVKVSKANTGQALRQDRASQVRDLKNCNLRDKSQEDINWNRPQAKMS